MSARYRSRSGASSYKAMLSGRRSRIYGRSTAARAAVTSAQRGYVRTGGYYGRFTKRGRRASNVEMKFLDTVVAGAALSINGQLKGSMNLVPQNVTESGRIGRKITVKSIMIRGDIHQPPGAGSVSANVVRFMMILDKQCNGALPAITDFLETATFSSFNNLENSARFRVLSDKQYKLQCGGYDGTGIGEDLLPINVFLKCNIPIEFDNSLDTGAITTIRSNNIFGFMITAQTSNVASGFTCRIRYTDN